LRRSFGSRSSLHQIGGSSVKAHGAACFDTPLAEEFVLVDAAIRRAAATPEHAEAGFRPCALVDLVERGEGTEYVRTVTKGA
jgi:hypothetical protein